MSSRSDLFLESDRTRAVNDLFVATSTNQAEPPIRLDPNNAKLTIRGSIQNSTKGVHIRTSSESPVARLGSAENSGLLHLHHESDTQIVSLDGDGDGHGRLRLYDAFDDTSISATTSGDGGRIELTHENGKTTTKLLGDDATLLLDGTLGEKQSTGAPIDAGGEVVLRSGGDVSKDVHVHVSGSRDSDYGVNAGNRPRIFLDGPKATLELGREELDRLRESVDGRVVIRDDSGNAVLELRVTEESGAEIVFRQTDGDALDLRGRIRVTSEGLEFYDSGDNLSMLIEKRGKIRTRKQIDEGGLPL